MDKFARAEAAWLTPPEQIPEIIYECCLCGAEICSGEEYLETCEGMLCPECLDSVTIREFARTVLGTTTTTAYKD